MKHLFKTLHLKLVMQISVWPLLDFTLWLGKWAMVCA